MYLKNARLIGQSTDLTKVRRSSRLGMTLFLLLSWSTFTLAQTQSHPSTVAPSGPTPQVRTEHPGKEAAAVQAEKKTPLPLSIIDKTPESAAIPSTNRPGIATPTLPPLPQPNPTPYFYYGPDGPEYFSLSRDQAVVKFEGGISPSQIAQILSQEAGVLPISAEQILPAPEVVLLNLAPNLKEQEIHELLERLAEHDKVLYANPFLVYHDGTPQGILDQLTVGLAPGGTLTELQQFASPLQVEIEFEDEFMPGILHLRVLPSANGNALDMARIFHESGLFEFAEPDFLLRLKTQTNDQFYDFQWSLENTGSAIQYNGTIDADMDVDLAWATTTGSASISVAILDEGVDLTHPDLVGNMLSGYDATGLGSGGGPSGDDAHGTACAGIVAATANNNIGVAGVAYSCKIVPIRIAYSNGGGWITSNTWISNSINWAWNQGGADVLSNSWGGGGASSLINTAITNARTNGRGGLGCPVLFAAGNGNGAVNYPANNNETISVAAMSMCNERKSPFSCDGETFWGSDFGTNLDIAAPGVKIYTTDISGSSGYSSGDYAPTFNGTSSACPNAAGVMALLLSYDPTLTETQARNTLETTCTKVGGYTYISGVPGQPNGSWSSDLGYGCVNALAALNALSGGATGNGEVFAYRAFAPGGEPQGPVSFDLAAPGTLYLIDDQNTQNFLSAGAWANDTWYAADYYADSLLSVDTLTGARTYIGALGAHFDGMTWDPTTNTMYGIDFNGGFYTVNLATGAATAVSLGTTIGYINLACSPSGTIYTMSIISDSLYTVNKTTGAITGVGPLGVDISFAQDMEFDPVSGILYMAALNFTLNAGELRTVDINTGATTLVGTFEGSAEITAMAIPGSMPVVPPPSGGVFAYRAFQSILLTSSPN
ncbi:MAG: S8 family serine peptidase [Bacteroidota bacterium]